MQTKMMLVQRSLVAAILVTDADHSDACSEKQAVEMVDGVEAAVVHDAGVGGAVVTEQMIEEEKKLQQQAEMEARREKEERDQVRFEIGDRRKTR